MCPNSATIRTLHELDSLGVGIVLDDFGTGYSSRSWLKQRPFREIKIDRSFISGLPDSEGDLAIVGGVIAMARAFGSLVTAEGVETKEQLALLQTLDCDRVQGFLFARPLGFDDLARFLSIGSAGPTSPVTDRHQRRSEQAPDAIGEPTVGKPLGNHPLSTPKQGLASAPGHGARLPQYSCRHHPGQSRSPVRLDIV